MVSISPILSRMPLLANAGKRRLRGDESSTKRPVLFAVCGKGQDPPIGNGGYICSDAYDRDRKNFMAAKQCWGSEHGPSQRRFRHQRWMLE